MKSSYITVVSSLSLALAVITSYEESANANNGVDDGQDLVYTPVPLCRVFDSRDDIRPGGGDLFNGDTRDYLIRGTGAQIAPQGGDPAGCTAPRGEPVAVHLKIANDARNSAGFARVNIGAFGGPNSGTASADQFSLNQTQNTGTQIICSNCAFDVTAAASINGTGSLRVVGDVVGYYYEPLSEDIVRDGHAGTDIDVVSVSNLTTYQVLQGPNYDNDGGTGDTIEIEGIQDVWVRGSMQAWAGAVDAMTPVEFQGEVTPCYLEGSSQEPVLCRTLEGPEAETDFCFRTLGLRDQRSVQTSCVFRGLTTGVYEFALCARRRSDFQCPSTQTFSVSGIKVDVITLED
ncbi:MAG: hypothetical protein AAGD10_20440 [Myxococcota bacterium]